MLNEIRHLDIFTYDERIKKVILTSPKCTIPMNMQVNATNITSNEYLYESKS